MSEPETDNSVTPGTITGRHVLIGMVLFFAAIIAVNSVMLYTAISTFGGVERKDSYRVGLAYNQRIADEKRQNELGWTETLAFDKTSNTLQFSLKDRDGRGVGDLNVVADVERPVTNIFDRQVALKGSGDGRYTADLNDLPQGTWAISLAAHEGRPEGTVVYRAKTRICKQC